MRLVTSTVVAVCVATLLTGNALAVPPPENATDDEVATTDIVYAAMENVDDVGLIIVWNGNGANTVGSCAWSGGGNHGTVTKKLDSKVLTKGENYLFFVIYNKVYDGGILFAGGKWSGNMSVKKNGETVWRDSKHVTENDKELKYWVVHRLDVSDSGKIEISAKPKLSKPLAKEMTMFMAKLEDRLNSNLRTARPFD